MSINNLKSKLEYEKQILALQEEVAKLQDTLQQEREEYKEMHKNNKNNDHNSYVDEEYYKESQYIHSLKQQIISLTHQNDRLKQKNRHLMEELEWMNSSITENSLERYTDGCSYP